MNECSSRRMFKKLTPSNWREHDTTGDCFVRINPDGSSRTPSDDEWAALILKAQLSLQVPQDVRNLFEVAQGVLCYGCYFYPLYTLGSEQLFRVMEAAVSHKCMQLDAPKNIRRYAESLKWLKARGVLEEPRFGQWSASRQLRNISSHASRQSLFSPPMAVDSVELTAELINELFQKSFAPECIA